MAEGWDGRHGEALERVGVGVRVGRAVGGQVAGVAGLLLGGGGAVVAALGVGQDLGRAGDLGGGGGGREGLGAGRVPHRLCRRRGTRGRERIDVSLSNRCGTNEHVNPPAATF